MTIGLITVNVILFLWLSVQGDTQNGLFMFGHGAMYAPSVVEEKQYYRLITSMFLHFGPEHLMNNMVLLGALGWNLEMLTGKVKLIIIYLAGGLAGNLCSLFWDIRTQEYAVSAGASGAVFALMGALLWAVIYHKGRIGQLTRRGMLMMAILSLYFGFASGGVDNAAHIGGLLGGFLLSMILYHRKN